MNDLRAKLENALDDFSPDGDTTDAMLEAVMQVLQKHEPVVWMQSDHLMKFSQNHCGAESMLARCSSHQLHPDYKPLYREPTPPSVPGDWKPIAHEDWSFDVVDLLCADGSILMEVMPQSDGDFWWDGAGPRIFIDPAISVTHWRLAALKE